MEKKFPDKSNRKKIALFINENKIVTALIILLLLVIIVLLPGIGILPSFAIILFLLWLTHKEGSIADIGFRRPKSWVSTILISFLLAVIIELSFQIFVNPFLEFITNTKIDLSPFEGIRGNLLSFLSMLLVGWLIGGFVEEIIFRGYMITRLRKILGNSLLSLFFILILTSVPFGLSHLYQGASGMLSTGLIAFIFGIIFIKSKYNLWLPIFTHGFVNTVGFSLIYFRIDLYLRNIW
jgi:membrane protease YdiL (CAAX protease family)